MAHSRDYSGERSRSRTRSRSRSRSRTRPRSLFGIPDPRPGKSDPEQRQLRKQKEEEGNFNWKPLIIVGLIGTTLWRGFNKSLDKCEKQHEEEDRMEEERRRRRRRQRQRDERSRDTSYGAPSRGRDPSYRGDDRRRDPRRRSEGGFRHGEDCFYHDGSTRGRSRPVSHVEVSRGRDYVERYERYNDPRDERDMGFDRPVGAVYRERMRRRDSSW